MCDESTLYRLQSAQLHTHTHTQRRVFVFVRPCQEQILNVRMQKQETVELKTSCRPINSRSPFAYLCVCVYASAYTY